MLLKSHSKVSTTNVWDGSCLVSDEIDARRYIELHEPNDTIDAAAFVLRTQVKNAIIEYNHLRCGYVEALRALQKELNYCCHKSEVDVNSQIKREKYGYNRYAQMSSDLYYHEYKIIEIKVKELLSVV